MPGGRWACGRGSPAAPCVHIRTELRERLLASTRQRAATAQEVGEAAVAKVKAVPGELAGAAKSTAEELTADISSAPKKFIAQVKSKM